MYGAIGIPIGILFFAIAIMNTKKAKQRKEDIARQERQHREQMELLRRQQNPPVQPSS